MFEPKTTKSSLPGGEASPPVDESDKKVLARMVPSQQTVRLVSTTKSPDLRLVWQSALIDAFLTLWLPDALVKEASANRGAPSIVS